MKYFVLILLAISIIPFVSSECLDNQTDINIASLKELDNLNGIGPAKGQAIIDARPFDVIDDLIKVKGIGEITLNKIKQQNLACVKEEEAESIKEKIDVKKIKNITEIENKDVIILKEDKVIVLNSLEENKKDNLIYASKNSKMNDYLSYAFSIFLIFIIVILIREKF